MLITGELILNTQLLCDLSIGLLCSETD